MLHHMQVTFKTNRKFSQIVAIYPPFISRAAPNYLFSPQHPVK